MTSGGHMPAESPAQVEPKMSIAAGMTARAQGQREHGPARAQAAHVSARADTRVSQRSMRLLRRTCREGHRAPPKVLILVVFAEALQVVSSAPLPSGDSLGLRTRIVRSQVSRTVTIGFMGFGRCGRERALEGVVTLTIKATRDATATAWSSSFMSVDASELSREAQLDAVATPLR